MNEKDEGSLRSQASGEMVAKQRDVLSRGGGYVDCALPSGPAEDSVWVSRSELMAGILVGIGGEHDVVPSQEQLDRTVDMIFRQAGRREQDALSPKQVDRLRAFAKDLQDAEPDISDDDRENAYNRGYADSDIATGKALTALLDVRLFMALVDPRLWAQLDPLPEATSAASTEEIQP